MKKAGLTEVQLQLLPGARHDLLHEKASGNARRAVELLTDFLREA